MKYSAPMLLLTTTVITMLFGPVAVAEFGNDNEVPSIYPGVWYRIAFDENGQQIRGDGDGDGWHYYAASNIYRMWFYNNPYDPDRKGYLNYEVYIKAVDPNLSTYAEVRFNWTTPAWSALNRSGPPLPSDVPTLADESLYMESHDLHTVDNWKIGTVEPIKSYTIEAYNPEWISVDIIGRNAYIYRGAWHECLEKGGGSNGGGGQQDYTVCCNRTTGHCYTIYGGTCGNGYETLAAGLTCDDCIKASEASLDFGDAPDPTYPTLLASDGARHTIVPGIHLGRGVDAELDGQPNPMAFGDDENGADEDGVVFKSAIQPGDQADIEVTASVEGYLNAWVDFDGNGRFDGPDEQVFVDTSLAVGINHLTFQVPDGAARGSTFARFRFNTRGLVRFDGPASDGEVEDYAIDIVKTYGPYPTSGLTSARWSQLPAATDAASPYFLDGTGVWSSLDLHQVAADDLQFEDGLPITGIHWWGTFDGWTESYLPNVTPLAFHVAIWTDVPDSDPKNPNTFNHPGTLLWEYYCTSWTWAMAGYQHDAEGAKLGQTCFQFSHLLSQDQWFHPVIESTDGGGKPAFYWVSIASFYDPEGPQPEHEWGWLTRPHGSGESATIIEQVTEAGSTTSLWPPTVNAQWLRGIPVQDESGTPWDMAFQLTTYGPFEDGTQSQKSASGQSKDLATLAELALVAESWLDAAL